MSTKSSIRYFNALAAVCYDHNLLDDYDFSFQDMGRNFNLCGRDDLIIILVKSTHVKTFLDVVSDVMPAQFERATALITGIVLSANGNTIAHEFANSSNRETDDNGSSYPFPYAMNLTCRKDIFTLCVVCAKSEQYEELLDELIDDAAHLITRHGANLPVGYIPAHVLNNAPKENNEDAVEEYGDLDEDVKEVIKNASASFHGTTEFESHVHEASYSAVPPIHTTGYIAPMEDDASYEPLTDCAVDVVDAPFTLDEESSNLLTGDSKLKRSFASLFSIEDDETVPPDIKVSYPDGAELPFSTAFDNLTECDVNNVLSTYLVEDVIRSLYATYTLSQIPDKVGDYKICTKLENIEMLFKDFIADLREREVDAEQHTSNFLLFDTADDLETIHKNYFTDLRGMSTLGIYRTIVADTELRAEWFLASITVDNYTDIIRLMFPRQYNGITTGYIKEFFEELLNNPTDNELYFALDNGFYKVKFVVANALHNPLLLARVECNFPVTPHGNDSKES